jgi:hypothetical protein
VEVIGHEAAKTFRTHAPLAGLLISFMALVDDFIRSLVIYDYTMPLTREEAEIALKGLGLAASDLPIEVGVGGDGRMIYAKFNDQTTRDRVLGTLCGSIRGTIARKQRLIKLSVDNLVITAHVAPYTKREHCLFFGYLPFNYCKFGAVVKLIENALTGKNLKLLGEIAAVLPLRNSSGRAIGAVYVYLSNQQDTDTLLKLGSIMGGKMTQPASFAVRTDQLKLINAPIMGAYTVFAFDIDHYHDPAGAHNRIGSGGAASRHAVTGVNVNIFVHANHIICLFIYATHIIWLIACILSPFVSIVCSLISTIPHKSSLVNIHSTQHEGEIFFPP